MRLSEALLDGFNLWLESRWGANFSERNRMDPFGTSLRGLNRVGPWLQSIRDTNKISIGGTRLISQAYTDLRSMSLIVRPRSSAPYLTSFGERVISLWEKLDLAVDDAATSKEIARSTALLRLALEDRDREVRAKYSRMYRAWMNLLRLQPSDYWLQNLVIMYMPEYLDITDERGYNPFKVLVAVNGGHIGTESEWEELAADQSWQGHAPLSAMIGKLRSDNRTGGSSAFRRAIEIIDTAHFRSTDLPALLDDWGIPR